jgi:hypothetical protein
LKFLKEMVMPSVVVVGGLIECSHGGKTKIKTGNSKLKIDDAEVVVVGMEVGLSFLPVGSPPTPDNPAPCTQLAKAGTPPPPSPCTATVAATKGISTKIKVNNLGVLLDTATGNAINPNDPAATWKISDPGQTKLQEL